MIAADLKKDPELYVQTLRNYFEDNKNVNAAARWNARGLSLEDSIRKTLVDLEVRQNITNKRL